MLRKLRLGFEIATSLLGFIWLFGPAAWQTVNRTVTLWLLTALLVILIAIAIFFLVIVIQSIRQPPYDPS
jgi:hypothetical protein